MVIALLTDFGTKDYFAGAMKGAILKIAPAATLVDITHEIAPHNIREAAFTLAACYNDFPETTIFVCVVDPGVGSERRAIAAKYQERIFVAPDNGILSFLTTPRSLNHDDLQIHEISDPAFIGSKISSTFHGRDIFAPAAAHLSLGTSLSDLGPIVTDPVLLPLPEPNIENGKLHAEIIHIDRFGNLVTNLRPEHLSTDFTADLNGKRIARVLNNYSEAAADEAFFIAGSAGFIEISVRESSAANLLMSGISDKLAITTNEKEHL